MTENDRLSGNVKNKLYTLESGIAVLTTAALQTHTDIEIVNTFILFLHLTKHQSNKQ